MKQSDSILQYSKNDFFSVIFVLIILQMNSQHTDELPPFGRLKLRRSIREDIWQSAINDVAKEGFPKGRGVVVKIKSPWGTDHPRTIYYLRNDTMLGFPAYVLSQNQFDCMKENGFLVVKNTDPISGYVDYIVYRDFENGAVPVIRMSRQEDEMQ
jgi:hypothetical protein